jgi:hypothetical protein
MEAGIRLKACVVVVSEGKTLLVPHLKALEIVDGDG